MVKKLAKTIDKPPIAVNRKARHDYTLGEIFQAGLVLTGWEVKSIRAARVQLKDSYVHIRNDEAWLINCHISPLASASAHIEADPTRNRKLLLHQKQIKKLIGAVQREGYTLVPIKLYWARQFVKLELALAKGKKTYDKRQTEKEREWKRSKERLMKH